MGIKELAEKYENYIIEKRRYFHCHPELSFEEKETTATLVKELKDMGMEVVTFPDYYGCIGILKGGKPGPTVMLRADIDALPVKEATELPFASEVEGRMHACGHDSHMAMLLGAAKILTECKNEWKGTVKFIFQAAEESCHGAEYYAKNGCMDGVDAVMGMHIWHALNSDRVNFQSGPRMACADTLTMRVHGLSSHGGSSPHLGHDALIAAAAILMNVQTYVSRRNDPLNPLVISFCTIHGGKNFNIIADEVELTGTMRTFSRELRARIEKELRQMIQDTAKAYGCTADFEIEYHFEPLYNEHEDLVRIAQGAVSKLYGEETLAPLPQMMGGEDFSYLAAKAPAVFGYIGSRNEAKGTIYGNHNDHYNVDEDSLKMGAAVYAQFAVDFLDRKAGN
ncbi:MAG: amidohydrolase [Lachnospiraceae bacterium]|nr:amidohydrolase [Lachnospiraceae bacterium]